MIMSEIKVGDYLFQRLAQLNIKTVWGVPGGWSRT
jgi:TPP-dependent 2-oxoacid decarboxylase